MTWTALSTSNDPTLLFHRIYATEYTLTMKLKNYEAKGSKNISPDKVERMEKVQKMESLKGTEGEIHGKNEKEEEEEKNIAPLDLKF